MFKRRNKTLRTLYFLSDLIMTALAFFVFNIIRYKILSANEDEMISGLWLYLGTPKLIAEQIIVPLVLMCTYILSGFYNTPFPRSRLQDFLTTVGSGLVNTSLIFMTMLINDPTPQRRTEYYLFLVLFLLLVIYVYTGRLIITDLAVKKAKNSNLIFKTVIIGSSPKGHAAAEHILSVKSPFQNCISAFVDIEGEPYNQHKFRGIPILKQKDLHNFCIREKISQIVLAPDTTDSKRIMTILNDLIDLDIPIRIAPGDLDYAMAGIRTNDVMGNTLIDLTSPRLSEFAKNIKRTFDLLFSILGLLILLPFLAIIALIIKIDSKGPVFYSQERIGRHRKPFNIIKFRTMRTDAESGGPMLSSDNDRRVTKVGRVLRKYRLDELPQLINVLKGEMSIVGPRPERDYYIQQIVKEVPYFSLVHQVRPGITSWAMVKFGYASTLNQMVERTKFDMIYINNMSLLLDLKILIHTIRTIVIGAGK